MRRPRSQLYTHPRGRLGSPADAEDAAEDDDQDEDADIHFSDYSSSHLLKPYFEILTTVSCPKANSKIPFPFVERCRKKSDLAVSFRRPSRISGRSFIIIAPDTSGPDAARGGGDATAL